MRRGRRSDSGAAAVEFALVSPLLMVLLFGIVEYGYGLFELQSAYATTQQAARLAAQGVAECPTPLTMSVTESLAAITQAAATGNSFGGEDLHVSMNITPLDPDRTVPAVGDLLEVTLTYRPALDLFFVPYPDVISRSATSSVAAIGDRTLMSCTDTVVAP